MKISTRIVVSIKTDEVITQEYFDYDGPIARAIGGSGSTNKQKSQSQQQSQSGVAYNEPFLNLLFGQKGQFYGTSDGKTPNYEPGVFGYEPEQQGKFVKPDYTPAGYTGAGYTGAGYTPGQFTAVAPEGFKRLEDVAYESQASKLGEANRQNRARLREEMSQSGMLNSPAQYLEGSAGSAMDRSYMDSLQQAARDAFGQRLGLEEREAGRRTGYDVGQGAARTAYDVEEATRKTGYDVGQGAARTAFDVGEATRQTGFGEREAGRETEFTRQQSDDLWKRFMAKLAIALESSKYQQASGSQQGSGSGMSGGGSIAWGNTGDTANTGGGSGGGSGMGGFMNWLMG